MPSRPRDQRVRRQNVWSLRAYRADDAVRLREVFYSSVHEVASRYYSPEQIQAWAPLEHDVPGWSGMLERFQPFVVESVGELVGFADVQADGSIELFYVSGLHARQGIGTLLMQAIHERARQLGLAELTSRVSVAAQPLFAKWGFELVQQCMPVVRGVAMPNALMKKRIE